MKGLLLLSREIKKDRINSQVWGWRLSEELRGFFGPAYRDKVVMTIDREAKRRQAASQVAAFDRLAQVPPARLQALLQETDTRTLVDALYSAATETEDALLGAMSDETRKKLEEMYSLYDGCPSQFDVTQAQEKILRQWEVMKP